MAISCQDQLNISKLSLKVLVVCFIGMGLKSDIGRAPVMGMVNYIKY